jgi:hypothetical protein
MKWGLFIAIWPQICGSDKTYNSSDGGGGCTVNQPPCTSHEPLQNSVVWRVPPVPVSMSSRSTQCQAFSTSILLTSWYRYMYMVRSAGSGPGELPLSGLSYRFLAACFRARATGASVRGAVPGRPCRFRRAASAKGTWGRCQNSSVWVARASNITRNRGGSHSDCYGCAALCQHAPAHDNRYILVSLMLAQIYRIWLHR